MIDLLYQSIGNERWSTDNQTIVAKCGVIAGEITSLGVLTLVISSTTAAKVSASPLLADAKSIDMPLESVDCSIFLRHASKRSGTNCRNGRVSEHQRSTQTNCV